MNINTFKKTLWNAKLMITSNVLQNYEYLYEHQYLSNDYLCKEQNNLLNRLLNHAYARTKYYKEVFDRHEIYKNGKINLEKFYEIPLLSKDAIRENIDSLASSDLCERKWQFNMTGGSTGVPLKIIQDNNYLDWKTSIKQLYDDWTGYEPCSNKIILWGSERDIHAGSGTCRARVGRWIRNELWINALRIKPEQLREIVVTINRHKPVQILAYAQSLYELAIYIKHNNLMIQSPRSIITSATTLTPHMRNMIESTFRAPVFNRYGCREVGDIACECNRHSGMHVCPLTHFVEIVDADGNHVERGHVGEVVVTSLVNYAMPLIRYKIEDISAWSTTTCDCGRPWPLLETISGRVTDNFITKSGEIVYGGAFTRLFYGKQWVKRFQIIQVNYDIINISIIAEVSAFSSEIIQTDIKAISEQICMIMGNTCNVTVNLVDVIPTTSSGKHRYTVSHVINSNNES